MANYYDNIDEFNNIEPIVYVMSFDIVQLISHNNHSFHKQFYFYSLSVKVFYKYDEDKRTVRRLKGVSKNNNALVRYRLVDDNDKDYEILLSQWFLMKSLMFDKQLLKRF